MPTWNFPGAYGCGSLNKPHMCGVCLYALWRLNATIRVMLKLTTVFFLLALSVLAVLHKLALTFFLYWRWEWFDVVMHFFGGAVAALGLFTLRDFWHRIPERLEYVVPIMSGVIIITLLWEIFEVVIGVPAFTDGYTFDTITDVALGIAGGFIGFLVGHSLRRL